MEADIKITGLQDIKRVLQQTKTKLGNLSIPLNMFAADLRKAITNEFISESDLFGIPWAALARSTLEIRKKRGNFKESILDDSGDLKNSIKIKVVNDGVQLSTTIPYAGIQDQGGWISVFGHGKAHLVARHFFVNDESDIPQFMIDLLAKRLLTYIEAVE